MTVITEQPPQLSHFKVQKLIQSLYGFEVSVSALDSERDQNFHLKSNDGNDYDFPSSVGMSGFGRNPGIPIRKPS